jgi:hypothetical protein
MHPTHHQPDPTTTGPANTTHPVDHVTGPADTPSSILRRAAHYLERHGWTWGCRYEERTETVPAADVVGAIRIAVVGDPVHDTYDTPEQATQVGRTLACLTAFLHLDQADPIESLTEWNDTVPTNTGDTVTALRDAASWCEARSSAYATAYTNQVLGSAVGR